jgi:hypothetical protein
MSAHLLNPSSLAHRAELHASLFAKMFLNSKFADHSAQVLSFYQNYEMHPDYLHAFEMTLHQVDSQHSVTSYETFRARYQERLTDQLHELISTDPAHFQNDTIEQVAEGDAALYAEQLILKDQVQVQSMWSRISLGLGHPPYRTAFVHALMQRDVSPHVFHEDLKRFRAAHMGASTESPQKDTGEVLNHLADKHAQLYMSPLQREQAGYDKTRLIGDIFALKGDAEYWSVFEHTLLESDPEFGSVYLYCFRQDLALFEAHRKELDENTPDLLAFGVISDELVALDNDEVLQGGMAGILRTAHGHSEKGVYTGANLPKRSFASAVRSLETAEFGQ